MKRKYIVFFEDENEKGRLEVINKKLKNIELISILNKELREVMKKPQLNITGILPAGIAWLK